jgi:hypothetical protein
LTSLSTRRNRRRHHSPPNVNCLFAKAL